MMKNLAVAEQLASHLGNILAAIFHWNRDPGALKYMWSVTSHYVHIHACVAVLTVDQTSHSTSSIEIDAALQLIVVSVPP
jgi:hypothetical protein